MGAVQQDYRSLNQFCLRSRKHSFPPMGDGHRGNEKGVTEWYTKKDYMEISGDWHNYRSIDLVVLPPFK